MAQLVFNAALLLAVAIFIGLFALLMREIRPFKSFERGVAALLWSFPLSVLATTILVYLDTPYFFLSLFGGPGLSALVLPPAGSRVLRILGGLLLAVSVFITLVTTGVLDLDVR